MAKGEEITMSDITVMTVVEVAAHFRVTVQTVRKWCSREHRDKFGYRLEPSYGKRTGQRMGIKNLFTLRDIHKFMNLHYIVKRKRAR